MSTHDHERSISTEAVFTIRNEAGQESSVYRELALIEKDGGGWLVAVTEPDPTQPEGDVLGADTIVVPDEAAGVFDDLFTRIADPARLGVGRR